MATAIADILEGAAYTKQNGATTSITRRFIVHGCTATEAGYADAYGEVPSVGTAHPEEAGLKASGYNLKPKGTNDTGLIIELDVTYTLPGGGTAPSGEDTAVLSGSSSLEQIETANDRTGEQIILQHDDFEPQSGIITPLVPVDEINFEQREEVANPRIQQQAYMGKVNSDSSIWGRGSRQWLCVAWDYERVANTATPTYIKRMTFRGKDLGHDFDIWMKDPETGEPIPKLVDGVGKKTVEWYDEADFSALGLTP